MRGLRKYLTPFAPDQSGAVSVLFELGGIVVICDAGGCTGNVCGFDEPRWFSHKSVIYSAGLRDMDAILGRDDRMIDKLVDATEKVDASFVALIGTPVPAVIGTDYKALKKMAEKKIDIPIMTIDANGMKHYDSGEEKAWLTLFKTFAAEKYPTDDNKIGILGMTPQDMNDLDIAYKFKKYFSEKYSKGVICFGMGAGLEEIKRASSVSKNIVVSTAAIETAKYLEDTFGIPYEIRYPLVHELIPDIDYTDKKIIVVHQQVIAASMREELYKKGARNVQNACWFMMKDELICDGDIALRDEDDYIELVQSGEFDIIFADVAMKKMTPDFKGLFINTRHFAVSGKLIGD